MDVRRFEFKTMRDAVAHAAAADFAALMLDGKPTTISREHARHLEEHGIYFAYICQHKGELFTIPVNEDRAEPKAIYTNDMFEAIKDNFSPEAVATMASYLDTANSTVGTNSPSVNHQVAWFAHELRTLVGGDEEYSRLCQEVGL